MKNIVLVLFLLSPALTGKAQMNFYHPFPDSNAVWGMVSGCTDVSCGDWKYIQDYYVGDTLIGSFSYKKIHEELLLMTAGNCCSVPETAGPGYLREDTAGRKVYWRTASMSSDSLLYDFTLNPGDTLKGYFNNYGMGPWVVQSVDSILVGSTFRKRINFDTTENSFYFSIIEGIGSTTGLTALYWGHFERGISLQCFSVNGIIQYTSLTNPDTIACGTLPESLNENTLNKHSVFVYPNPAQNIITVEAQPELYPVHIVVCSTQGALVMEKQVQQDDCTIDISTFPSGIYFLQENTINGPPTVIKVIKQ